MSKFILIEGKDVVHLINKDKITYIEHMAERSYIRIQYDNGTFCDMKFDQDPLKIRNNLMVLTSKLNLEKETNNNE